MSELFNAFYASPLYTVVSSPVSVTLAQSLTDAATSVYRGNFNRQKEGLLSMLGGVTVGNIMVNSESVDMVAYIMPDSSAVIIGDREFWALDFLSDCREGVIDCCWNSAVVTTSLDNGVVVTHGNKATAHAYTRGGIAKCYGEDSVAICLGEGGGCASVEKNSTAVSCTFFGVLRGENGSTLRWRSNNSDDEVVIKIGNGEDEAQAGVWYRLDVNSKPVAVRSTNHTRSGD